MSTSAHALVIKFARYLLIVILAVSFFAIQPISQAIAQSTSVISNVSDSPDSFSPNGDSQYDQTTIYFTLSENAWVTVRVYNSANELVRTLLNNVQKNSDSNSVDWDGRDASGKFVPDALYKYTIDATNVLGNSTVQQSGDILVDTRKAITLTSHATGTVLSGTVQLVFTQLSDYTISTYNYYNYAYWYCTNGSQIQIGYLAYQTDGTWTVDWNTNSLVNGTCEIRVYNEYYTDSRGSQKSAWFSQGSFTVDNGIEIHNVSDSPDSFSPNGDNQYDSTTLNFTVSEIASVTIDVYNSSHILVRTLAFNQSFAAGSNSLSWDGRDNAGAYVPDGLYTYTIDAVDSSGNNSPQQSGDVLVDTRNPLTLTSDCQRISRSLVFYLHQQCPIWKVRPYSRMGW